MKVNSASELEFAMAMFNVDLWEYRMNTSYRNFLTDSHMISNFGSSTEIFDHATNPSILTKFLMER